MHGRPVRPDSVVYFLNVFLINTLYLSRLMASEYNTIQYKPMHCILYCNALHIDHSNWAILSFTDDGVRVN